MADCYTGELSSSDFNTAALKETFPEEYSSPVTGSPAISPQSPKISLPGCLVKSFLLAEDDRDGGNIV